MPYPTYCALLLCLGTSLPCCYGQPDPAGVVGGPFENRELFYAGMPDEIGASDTTAGWYSGGQRLVVHGRILHPDGVTPAPGVVLYYYHTDDTGVYPNLDGQASRHGALRGWVRSDANGRYAIYTVRPAAYPGRQDPAHLHPALLEPSLDLPYYIDEWVFDDDPRLTTERRRAAENRGGSGVLRVRNMADRQVAEHNVILGLNIPNHPAGVNRQHPGGNKHR